MTVSFKLSLREVCMYFAAVVLVPVNKAVMKRKYKIVISILLSV
jgi:hypothetical protein